MRSDRLRLAANPGLSRPIQFGIPECQYCESKILFDIPVVAA